MHEVALLLGRFLGQDVTVEGMLPLDFSGAGQLETLFGRRIGFYFWHYSKPLTVEKIVNRPQRYEKKSSKREKGQPANGFRSISIRWSTLLPFSAPFIFWA